jgi:hypothetical protein
MSLSAEIALSQVFPAPAKRPSESALVPKDAKELTDCKGPMGSCNTHDQETVVTNLPPGLDRLRLLDLQGGAANEVMVGSGEGFS